MPRIRPLGAAVVALALGCHPAHTGGDGGSTAPHAHADGGTTVARGDGGTEDPCGGLTEAQRTAVVARVGDQRLTLCDFARRMNLQNPYQRARFNSPEARRALVQSWVDAELLAAEAHDQGLDQDPEVRRAITMRLARAL